MSENTAIIIELVLIGLVALGAIAAGVVYALTKGEHGGVIGFILGFVALSAGGDLWNTAQHVLTK